MELLFDSVRRAVDLRHPPAEPMIVRWALADARPGTCGATTAPRRRYRARRRRRPRTALLPRRLGL